MTETLKTVVHEILDAIYRYDNWNLDPAEVDRLVNASGYDTTGLVDASGRPVIMLRNMGIEPVGGDPDFVPPVPDWPGAKVNEAGEVQPPLPINIVALMKSAKREGVSR